MKRYPRYPGVRKPPKSTHFTYPNGYQLKGEVIAETPPTRTSGKGGDYLFVIQKIRYPSKPRKLFIRFAYYRKEHKETKWRWGSQTTYHSDTRTTAKIIRKAIAMEILSV